MPLELHDPSKAATCIHLPFSGSLLDADVHELRAEVLGKQPDLLMFLRRLRVISVHDVTSGARLELRKR